MTTAVDFAIRTQAENPEFTDSSERLLPPPHSANAAAHTTHRRRVKLQESVEENSFPFQHEPARSSCKDTTITTGFETAAKNLEKRRSRHSVALVRAIIRHRRLIDRAGIEPAYSAVFFFVERFSFPVVALFLGFSGERIRLIASSSKSIANGLRK